ncbi:MerR family transcriptional regulator [Oerskovia sp. M15]
MCERAGAPLTAVKYYQREGLLPPGIRSAPNQVEYGDAHVRRVRLVRALLETGGLTIAATKDVIAALDDHDASLVETFRVAQHSMSGPRAAASAPSEAARARVAEIAASQGWRITPDNPGIDAAARAIDGLLAIGFDAPPSTSRPTPLLRQQRRPRTCSRWRAGTSAMRSPS